MNRISENTFLFILIIVSLLLFNFVFIANRGKIPMTAPDEETSFFFANNLIQNGNYLWESELNSRYSVSYFRPRGALEFKPNLYSPLNSLTFINLIAIAKIFGFYYNLVSIFAVIGVIFVYLIARELFNSKKCGIIAATLISIFPVYVIYANSLFDIIPSIVTWLGGVFLYVKFIKTNQWKYLYFTGLIALLSINLRPDMVLLCLPFIFFHLIKYKSFLKSKQFIFFGIFVLFLFFLLFYQNKVIYGSFFSSGRQLLTSGAVESGTTGFVKGRLLTISPLGLILAVKNYFYPYILIFIFGFLGLLSLYKEDNKDLKVLFFTFIILIIILLNFHTSSVPSSLYSEGIRSSISRMFLPIYLIFIILFSRFFKVNIIKNKSKKIIAPVILLVVITTLFNYGVNASSGFLALYNRSIRMDRTTSQIEEIEQESIIITNYLTYNVVPTKHNILLVYEKHQIAGPVYEALYATIESKKELILLVKKLLNDNWNILIFKDRNLDEISNFLIKNGFILENSLPSFYKILLPR